jgi:exosortase
LRLLNLILGLIAYRQLVLTGGWRGVTQEVEDWFFIPAETSPLVVLLICGWLLYRRRDRLRQLVSPGGPGWLAVALFSLGGAFFLWGSYTRAYDLLAPSLMLNALACAVLYRGIPGLRAVLVPVLILVFAVPLPAPLLSEVVWRFQLWTAEYTGWIFFAFGMPAHVSGDLIYRVGQTFEVIETCSGLRSVETLALLSVLMADLFKRGRLHSLLLLLATPIVAFAMNGFRVTTLILNPESEEVVIHNTQGVLVLLGGLVILYVFDGLLGRLPTFRGRESPGRAAVLPPSAAASGDGSEHDTRRKNTLVAVLLASLAAASFWITPWSEPMKPPRVRLDEQIPIEMGPWRASDLKSDRLFRGKVVFYDEIYRHYRLTGRHVKDPEPIELFIGLGAHRHRFRSPFSPKNAHPGAGWMVEEEGVTRFERTGPEVDWRVLRRRSRSVLVYFWHQGSEGFGHEVLRSFLALDTSPFGREQRVLVYRMSTDLREPTERERERAGRHMQRLYKEIHVRLQTPAEDSS